MAERKGSNRTTKGVELENKHQDNYNKWWLGKHIETPYYKNYPESEEKINGIATKVEYLGNSMCGVVEITLDNGYVYLVGGSSSSYRPCKKDVKCVG